MKILIIAPSRTGGRILNKWLSLELKHLFLHEPFHFHKESFIKTNEDLKKTLENNNIVVKVNYGDWKKMYEDENFFSLFNKIICLTRKDIYDTAISYTKALQTNNFTNGYNLNEEWIEKNIEEINKNYVYLEKQMLMTKGIKNTLHITYEGVYETGEDINKIKNYLQITELNHLYLLSKNLKYRNQIKFI